jgi:hypothetical protein
VSEFPNFGDLKLLSHNRLNLFPRKWKNAQRAIGLTTGLKNPHDAWNDLTTWFPEFVQKTDKYIFGGLGEAAPPTPIATR